VEHLEQGLGAEARLGLESQVHDQLVPVLVLERAAEVALMVSLQAHLFLVDVHQ
jgi:hypothetical protein